MFNSPTLVNFHVFANLRLISPAGDFSVFGSLFIADLAIFFEFFIFHFFTTLDEDVLIADE